jgi:hypothetical protein
MTDEEWMNWIDSAEKLLGKLKEQDENHSIWINENTIWQKLNGLLYSLDKLKDDIRNSELQIFELRESLCPELCKKAEHNDRQT